MFASSKLWSICVLCAGMGIACVTAAEPPGGDSAAVAGIVVDDDQAELTGSWVRSTKQPSLVGTAYRHDNHEGQGSKSARFAPKSLAPGEYELRLIYFAHPNRASNVPVTIASSEGEKTVVVNQRLDCLENGVPKALGVFRFAGIASVTVSNAGADGYVVVDGVQFIPLEIAQAERAGRRDSGFRAVAATVATDEHAALRARRAAAVAVSPLAPQAQARTQPRISGEPVQLAADTPPDRIDGRHFDLIVVGGTGGGVACAVRAARDGCSVLLVQHNRHIGGMMANGLMQWDALYGGPRAPLFTELLHNIEQHYVRTYGQDSPDHQIIRYTHEHYPIGWAEPHVAEREFNRLVAGEKNLTLLLSHYPVAVQREGPLVREITFREYGGAKEIHVQGSMFADATYEGDLLALARVPYRVGREAREEYGEPHAGKIYVNIDHSPAPRDAAEGRLNIRPYGSRQGSVDPTSPFSADGAVQAYNYRFCVTKDPENRILPAEPPPGYDREEYVHYERKSIATNAGPNSKSHMNSPILPGENHDYPEADWPAREKIIGRHKNFALGLMWFLQNDPSVPEARRARFRDWGLPKDEFADHGHIPYEMYVREARRIVGRHVFTEHDNSLAEGLARAPVHPDSVAVTDWYMDSHSCTTDSRPGFRYDGKLILTEESRPAQIPYRALLPQGVDNLLVPVCLSATHVAWGAVRLEPVWMQTGEAAGVAAALAKREKAVPAKLSAELLLRTLVQRRHLVSFFNDIKVDAVEDWNPAVQYLGTKGFFATYDARPGDPLDEATAMLWVDGLVQLQAGELDPMKLARSLMAVENRERAKAVTAADFVALFPQEWRSRLPRSGPETGKMLTRGEACRLLFKVR